MYGSYVARIGGRLLIPPKLKSVRIMMGLSAKFSGSEDLMVDFCVKKLAAPRACLTLFEHWWTVWGEIVKLSVEEVPPGLFDIFTQKVIALKAI